MADRIPDPGELTPTFAVKANPTAIVDGVTVDALALGSSKPYHRATVLALKPGADALTMPTANTGTVWICSAAEVLTGAFQLAPGASMELPPNCDLADFFLAVETADDGVLICYTQTESFA